MKLNWVTLLSNVLEDIFKHIYCGHLIQKGMDSECDVRKTNLWDLLRFWPEISVLPLTIVDSFPCFIFKIDVYISHHRHVKRPRLLLPVVNSCCRIFLRTYLPQIQVWSFRRSLDIEETIIRKTVPRQNLKSYGILLINEWEKANPWS